MKQADTQSNLEPYLITLFDGANYSAEDPVVEDFSFAIVFESGPGAAINRIAANLRDGIQVAGVLGLDDLRSKLVQMQALNPSQPHIDFDNEDWSSEN